MERGHRRVPYAVAGRVTIPGRFAIDWFKVDESGNAVSGIGTPVLAVADGVVADIRDDMPDPVPGSNRRSSLGDEAGNYVALDIGAGRYVFYEHLKRGLRVKTGDKVRQGQVIAFLGATGQVSGPHLHLHVADSNSTLGAEGVPYGFRKFLRLGRYDSISGFAKGGAWRSDPGAASGLPSPNAVLRFPD
jgi:murein DD-endopeptidase MepM/ murein hydrolase activator NlpD